MSGDRLATARAQKQRDETTAATPEGQEMAVLRNGGVNLGTMAAFYTEITSIQDGIAQFNDNVTKISELQSRSLSAVGDSQQREAAQLEALTAETRELSNSLKQRIASLNSPSPTIEEAQIRSDRAKIVSQRFKDAIQNYQKVKQLHQAKCRERIERQFKIVKTDATPEEVAAVLDDQGADNQIFAQALLSTTQYAESRTAYREVQERHQDIRKLEQTIAELGQLFIDMGTIVEEQDFPVITNLDNARRVAAEIQAGAKATSQAVASARRARIQRWICFCVCVVVLAAVGLGVGLHFAH